MQCFVGIDADLPRLLNDTISLCRDPRLGHGTGIEYSRDESDPRHIYRSIIPFLPPSSPILSNYNELSDSIRVLRVDRRIEELHIPFGASLQSSDVPPDEGHSTTLITCAALSDDGCQVALGFCDGVVEVVDAELGARVSRFADGPPSPPVWLLFAGGGSKLVTENSEGDVCILDDTMPCRRQFASRLDGAEMVMTSISHDGLMVVRIAQHSGTEWYENASIIRVAVEDLTIHALASPSLDHPLNSDNEKLRFPLRRSLGFSPDGQYVAGFDNQQGFIWSSTSLQIVAQYSIGAPSIWFLNTNHWSMPPFEFPDYPDITLVCEPPGSIPSSSCVLFTLRRRSTPLLNKDGDWGSLEPVMCWLFMEIVSQAAGIPLLSSWGDVWFRGHRIMMVPASFCDPTLCLTRLPPPRQSIPFDEAPFADFSLPVFKDGTRFLVCDEEGFPVVVDISGIVSKGFPYE